MPQNPLNKILGDHQKRGKVLIPPFLVSLGPINEVSWTRLIIPELLWIKLLHKKHGDHEAVRILTTITRVARKCFSDNSKRKFCFTTEWREFTDQQIATFCGHLIGNQDFEKFKETLAPLVSWYPKIPFTKFFEVAPKVQNPQDLVAIGSSVGELYARDTQPSTMVQASAIWTAFDSGSMVVNEGLALSRFPEIDQYPNTEISKQIAASIRATVNLLSGHDLKSIEARKWSMYFWTRGVEISECSYE